MLFVSMAMRRALYCVPMAFKGLHYATARVARRLLPRLRGSEHGLKPATMVVVGQRRRAKPHTGGGRRGATRAREGARVRMVRETACGRTGGEGGSNAGGMAYWGGGRPAKRATVETTAAATATTAAVKGGGGRRSRLQHWGGGEVGMCPRARIPKSRPPPTRLTLPYLWVRAGIIAIPARDYYLIMLMWLLIQSAARAEMARKPGANGQRGMRTRPRAGQ